MISLGLRGAGHVYMAVAWGYAALAWPSRAGSLIARSQHHYDRAQDLLGWLDEDDFPLD